MHNLQLISLLRACSCWVGSKRATHDIQLVGNHTAIWHHLLWALLHMVHGFSSLYPCPEGSKYGNQCLGQFFCLPLTPLESSTKNSAAHLFSTNLFLCLLCKGILSRQMPETAQLLPGAAPQPCGGDWWLQAQPVPRTAAAQGKSRGCARVGCKMAWHLTARSSKDLPLQPQGSSIPRFTFSERTMHLQDTGKSNWFAWTR